MKDAPVGRVALLVASLFLARFAPSQESRVDRRLEALIVALEEMLADDADADLIAVARRAVADYLDALGKDPQRGAAGLLFEDLKRHENGPFVIAGERTTQLFDEVRFHRTCGRPDRMLPALLALQTRHPRDARVLFGLGEAYGIAGPVFNAGKAAGYFRCLLDVLREKSEVATDPVGQGRLLAAFLPELSRAGLLLREEPPDTTARLRQQVMRFCEKLERGEAIGLWRLAAPELDRLYEQLIIARRERDQSRCRELLEAMLEIQPVNPIFDYSLAEVYASIGSEFDPDAAVERLDSFLELTDPAVLGGPADRRASVITGEQLARDLARFRRTQARSDLEAQRVAARELKGALERTNWSKKDSAPRFVFSPNRAELEKELRRVEKHKLPGVRKRLKRARNNERKFRNPPSRSTRQQRATYQRKLADAQQEIARYEAELKLWERWMACYEEALRGDLQQAIRLHEELMGRL